MEEFGHHFISTITPDERRLSSCDPFIVEDLLDFSHDEGVGVMQDGGVTSFDHHHHQNYAAVGGGGACGESNSNSDSSTVVTTPVDSCNSSFSGNNDPFFQAPTDVGSQFSGELGVPYDDLAHLEWLSNFVEESFSSEDSHKFHQIPLSALKARPDEVSEARYYLSEPTRTMPTPTSPMFSPEMPVPGKARSKRSRAAPCNWASRLLVVAPGASEPISINKPTKPAGTKKKEPNSGTARPNRDSINGGEVRKCLHCATDKTPQWRSGPMGPKTLCNACGVRYKSGRLVPEYRPAASPTFMLTKHSNSHRKVMELRRQKELIRQQQLQPQQQQFHQQLGQNDPNNNNNMIFDPCNGDDYLIHQHIGPDFRHLLI